MSGTLLLSRYASSRRAVGGRSMLPGRFYMRGNRMDDYIIEMLGITKEFPGIIANDNITLQLKKGKSTRC